MALLKGESVEEVSRVTGQPAHILKGVERDVPAGRPATFQVGESVKDRGNRSAKRDRLNFLKATVRMVSCVSSLGYPTLNGVGLAEAEAG